MFTQIFQKPYVQKRYSDASFLEERLRYLTYRAQQGAKLSVLQDIANFQLLFIKYLPLKNETVITRNEITSAANRWVIHAKRHYQSRNLSWLPRKGRFIQHATDWLLFLDRVEIPQEPPVPTEIKEFCDYLRNEKGIAEVTILKVYEQLQNFFKQIKEEPSKFLFNLTPGHLDELLARIFHEGSYARSSIQLYASRLRTFLRYAEYRGWSPSGIADSVKTPKSYAHQTLPSSPSWDDVQLLLKNTEGDSPSNIRARAIILLLAVYGLRGSEVRQLRFDDIDWEQETFRIRHSKFGPTQQFPLVQTVGRSLVDYIKKARPKCSPHREIFLTIHAPFYPLKSLAYIVGPRWKPLNVAIKHPGAHSLRHACATRLINQGISLKAIADQLGHRSLETTRIYAKVDLTRLREVANFDIGGIL